MDGLFLWDCADGSCRNEQGMYNGFTPGPRWPWVVFLIIIIVAIVWLARHTPAPLIPWASV